MGRPLGSKNKRTLTAEEYVASLEIGPLEVLADLMINGDDESTRLGAAKDLASYAYVKKRTLELTGDVNVSHTFLEKLKEVRELTIEQKLQRIDVAKKKLLGES